MSTKLDYTDDELYDEFEDEETEEERPAGAGAFRFVSVLFFLIAVAGLFIGMIPVLDSTITTGEGTWSGSMLFAIIESFKKLFGMEYTAPFFGLVGLDGGSIAYTGGVARLANYLPYAVAGAVVVSLIAMIVALISSKAAKGCAYVSGIISFFAYGFTFAYLFAARSYIGYTGLREITDLPMGIIVAAIFLVLLIMSAALKKGYGFANGIVVLLAMAGIVAFVYPGSQTIGSVQDILASVKDASLADVIILFGLSAILVFNLIVSIFRFAAKRGYAFDAIRHFVMFGFAVAAACLYVFAEGFTSPNWEILANLPLILLLASSLAAFLVSLLCAISVSVRKSKEIESEEEEDDEEDEDDDLGLLERPAEARATEIAPAADATATAVAVAEPPMSEFEKRMSEIAQGTQHTQPAQDNTVVYSGHYTYDAFMATLTGEEKTEFGNLFISKKYGMQNYLPAYVVGGNNDEFFSKVFIYLGKYRSYISASLLEKMYRFVNNEM